ncbi:MAG: hypothetical protein WEB53_16855 [Akkermansiaceae bacterium]
MKSKVITSAALAAIALIFTSCGEKTANTTESADTPAEAVTPAEAREIAEEGFIYALPLVMNYAIMNEHAVDTGGSQFKAPFNQIKNEPRVYT